MCDFSQLIPFVLYIAMCPDKQVQTELLSILRCNIKGLYSGVMCIHVR